MRREARDIYASPGAPGRAAPTAPLRRQLARAMPERAFTLRLWDGSELPATQPGGPTIALRSARALAHMVWAPGQLGLSRAYVSGDLETDDLDAVVGTMDDFRAPPLRPAVLSRLASAAVKACGAVPLLRRPPVPAAELRPRGRLHTIGRDARAVRHHYDLSNDFFATFLDSSMTYSCAIFSRGATTLEDAQRAKLGLVCDKLALRPGERVLDVGCGWGSFVIHAARRYGVRATGITISPAQAALARERVAREGVSENVEVRLADYRQLTAERDRYDAIASIGMVEHVGAERIDEYASHLASLLAPGGRLLNHGIARLRDGEARIGAFTQRYVFPDGDTLPLSRVQLALERAGFNVEHVEGFSSDYARTLAGWAARLDANLPRARRLIDPERLRVWRLYLRGARQQFEHGRLSVYQVRCRRA